MCSLVRQRLMAAEHKPDAGAFVQLRQQRRSGMQVGSIRIGCVGPNRVIDDLRRFFCVHVESGFHEVGLVADIAITVMTDRGRFVCPAMLVFEDALEGGCGVDLGVGSESLGLELF